MSRLVAVLGYSDASGGGLHPVCAARLERAAALAEPGDTVLFSGWARRGTTAPESELMARAWAGTAQRTILDRGARSTVANAAGIAHAVRALGIQEVVVVTSSWHGRRAQLLARAALAGSGVRVSVATTAERAGGRTRLRELACWSVVPVLALAASRGGTVQA